MNNKIFSFVEETIQNLPLEIIYRIRKDYMKTLNIIEMIPLTGKTNYWNPIIKEIFQESRFQILHFLTFDTLAFRLDSIDGEIILLSHQFKTLLYYLINNDISPDTLEFIIITDNDKEIKGTSVPLINLMSRYNDIETLIGLSKTIGPVELNPEDMNILFNYDFHLKFLDISLPVYKFHPWSDEYGNLKLSKFRSLQKITFLVVDLDCLKWFHNLLVCPTTSDMVPDYHEPLSSLSNLKKITFDILFDWGFTPTETAFVFKNFSKLIDQFSSINDISINIEMSKCKCFHPNYDPIILKYFTNRLTKIHIDADNDTPDCTDEKMVPQFMRYIEWLKKYPNIRNLEICSTECLVLNSNNFVEFAKTLRVFRLSHYKLLHKSKSSATDISLKNFKYLKSLYLLNCELPFSFFKTLPDSLKYFHCEGVMVPFSIRKADRNRTFLINFLAPKFLRQFYWENHVCFPQFIGIIPLHLRNITIHDIDIDFNRMTQIPHLKQLTNMHPSIPLTKLTIISCGNPNLIVPKFGQFSNIKSLEISNKNLVGKLLKPIGFEHPCREIDLSNLPSSFLLDLKIDLFQVTKITGQFPPSLLSLDIDIHDNDLSILTLASKIWEVKTLKIRYSGSVDIWLNSIALATVTSLYLTVKGNRLNMIRIHHIYDTLISFNIETYFGSKIPKLVVPKFTKKLRKFGIAKSFDAIEELGANF